MRIARNAFAKLALGMMGFGLVIGLVFPFAVLPIGFDRDIALSAVFFAFTITAGLIVGAINVLLARVTVLPRLRTLAERMSVVEEGIEEASYTGDWSHCDPEVCAIPIDSEDEFAEVASSFNGLIHALSASHTIQAQVSAFADAMTVELDLDRLCASAIDHLRHTLGADAVAILSARGGEMEPLCSYGIVDVDALTEKHIVADVVRSLEPRSIQVPEGFALDGGLASFIPSEILVHPLQAHSVGIGVVVLGWSGDLPRGARALAPILLQTFSVALSNARAHADMERLAALDPLTGVYNRRFGLERLREEFARSIRYDRPLGVVMLDIDHFKAVNDTYGHLAGDAVLKRVADEARSVLREGDVLVRYGGEEFMAILPGAGATDVTAIAERIRRLIEGSVQRHAEHEFRVTLSAGHVSTAGFDFDGEIELVDAADEALYSAKRTGRNRTIAASVG
ncbi:MAG: GGDEF domain-containing protein [Acidimicrobiia bacterium]|nr:GGDEF domain-containing protein [Acidimicrobiia bacterium]